MNKYVCIHGHFYQPPRENPWLESIEVQDSAYPYRDWNERITAECYSPNTSARIIQYGKVVDIVNNYSKISFNFGPTLLSWMRTSAPDVYEQILQADKESQQRFSGHGSAIAQVYNHMIMPLANTLDKKTQIIWGIEDFKFHFKREPEGMWLAETAVDTETLELLAEQNIKFTILAPRQAGKVKKSGTDNWHDVNGGKIDPRRAYKCNLPSGKSINLFFYDGAISQELAFGNLLENGENLANRLVDTLNKGKEAQIAHIATDGETYGHHQKHGDMALAYCLHYIENKLDTNITIYGEFLEKFPPSWEVEIIENTSWSCSHGIERWKSNCGCNSGREGWNQEWRSPLREALDWLRDSVTPLYIKEAENYTKDVWSLRDNYIKVILNREPDNLNKFFAEHDLNNLAPEDCVKILKLLELQRHAMLMYTSCGWFFDEISGIETVQVVLYAARVMQIAKELELGDFENEFISRLQNTKSNIPEIENGAAAYERFVKPAIIDLFRVAAHYAVSSLFEEYREYSEIFCYEVRDKDYDLTEAGRNKLLVGRSVMRSRVTYEEQTISFAFLHLGDHNLNGGVRKSLSDKEFELMRKELKDEFRILNIAEIILLLDKHFGSHSYSLWHLFKDESRKVFNILMENTLQNIEISYRQIYESHYPMMQAMKNTETPLPKAMLTTVEYVLNTDLKKLLEGDELIDYDRYRSIIDEMKKWSVEADRKGLRIPASRRIINLMSELLENPSDMKTLDLTISTLRAFRELEIPLDIWKAQNICFKIYKRCSEEINCKADEGDTLSKEWLERFKTLEEFLQVSVS
jgi:alpha-amylase/alpha-mannosidase (GH57 family)